MIANIDNYETDLIFTAIVNFTRDFGWEYEEIYNLHILFIGISCVALVSIFSNKSLFIILIVCIFRYVDFANQLRYYSGFFTALISIYLFVVKRSYFWALLFSLFSILAHSSLIVLYGIIPAYKFLKGINLKKLLLFQIISFIGLPLIITAAITVLPQFAKYFISDDGKSSFVGGIFDGFPVFIAMFFVLLNHRVLMQKESVLLKDKKYIFLYSLSVFSFLLLPLGLYYRIVLDRFVFSMAIVWVMLLIYSLVDYRKYIVLQKFGILSFGLIIIFWFYFASLFFLGSSFYLLEAFLMLELDINTL